MQKGGQRSIADSGDWASAGTGLRHTGRFTGRSTPGVSRKMHWKSSSEWTAMILCRVVCALEVTMDSFCFRMAFRSVLLPELGFPTIAT